MHKFFFGFVFVWAACTGGKHYASVDASQRDGTTADGSNEFDAAIDSASPDAAPAHFVVAFGGASRITDMHTVSDGLIVSATVGSSFTLGTTQLVPGYVVAKLNTLGGVVWARSQTYTDNLQLAATGTTSTGDVIVAGAFVGAVNFGGTTLNSTATNWDLFIAKYSGSDGSHIWSVRYGAAGPEHAMSVVVDQAGDLYVTGYWTGSGAFGGATLTGPGMFIAKYSGADGSYLWGLRAGSSGNDFAQGFAVDANGVYACGTFGGTINFGGSDLQSAGANDIFVASFDLGNGNHRWSERFGSTLTTSNDSCANLIAAGGALYMTGSFPGALSVGGTTLTTQGSADIYVAKYDAATGSHVWSRSYGGTGLDTPASQLALGGNLLVTGKFQNTVTYSGGASISSAGGNDIFVQTLAQSDGSYVDAFRTGGSSDDDGTALAIVGGDLVVGGAFQGVCYFGTTQETAGGGMEDAFVYEP